MTIYKKDNKLWILMIYFSINNWINKVVFLLFLANFNQISKSRSIS